MTAPKKSDSARQGKSCCYWLDFKEGFEDHWKRWFDAPPTAAAWAAAERDWKAGNTGFEAAHNAQRRAKERVKRAKAKPLVWLGGCNYAQEGSELAKRFGRAAASQGDRGKT